MLIEIKGVFKVSYRIKSDCARLYGYSEEELAIDIYGEYDGTYVLIIDGPWGYPGVEVGNVNIGGVEFYFSSPRIPQAYQGGSFYSLREAYEEGLLTAGNLSELNQALANGRYERY